jgi:hypothetical protein
MDLTEHVKAADDRTLDWALGVALFGHRPSNVGRPGAPGHVVWIADQTPLPRYASTAAGAEAVIVAMGEKHDAYYVGHYEPKCRLGPLWQAEMFVGGARGQSNSTVSIARAVAEAAILALDEAGALPVEVDFLLTGRPRPGDVCA